MFCILLWSNNTWEIIKLKANDPFEGKFVVSEEAPRHTAPKPVNKPVKEKKAKKAKNKAVKKKGSKPRKAVLICGLIAAALLLVLTVMGVIYSTKASKAASDAKMLKASVKQTIEYLANGDADAADAEIITVEASIKELRADLDETKWKSATSLPFIGSKINEDLETARKAVNIADEATVTILKPASTYIRVIGKPSLDSLEMDDMGPDMAVRLYALCNMIDAVCPAAKKVMKDINELPEFNFDIIENEVSSYRELPQQAEFFIPIIETASTEILRPTADTMNRASFADLKTEDGMDTNIIRAYLDLEDRIEPHVMDICDQILTSPLINENPEKYVNLSNTLINLMKTLYEVKTYKPLIRLIIGNGEDRMFLVVAQNCAEMRACGGFPGAMGKASVKNGEFTFGDFETVLNYLPEEQPSSITITDEENTLFLPDWYGCNPIKATVNPDFPRAAEIMTVAYEEYNDETIDGVISLTPHIIQRLLTITGPVTLSNGVTLDDTNAVGYLQRQIYFDYFKSDDYTNNYAEANDVTDALFGECADLVFHELMNSISKDTIVELMNIITESSKDRVLMIWMKDPESQAEITNLGFSGAVYSDPEQPAIGVFYNVNLSCKLGPYIDYHVTMGDGTMNADGSYSYPVTVTLSNTIDDETLAYGLNNIYITSMENGADLISLLYLFAPAGGYISDIENDGDVDFVIEEYNGLQLGFAPYFILYPQQTITFTYTVTTAPGVTVRPEILTQPLIHDYCIQEDSST